MKDKYVKAVQSLKRKVTWLAKNGKIGEKLLNEYNDILISLAEYYNYSQKLIEGVEAETIEHTYSIDRLKEENQKLRLLLNLTGMPDTFIDEILVAPKKYLQKELDIAIKNKEYLQTPMLVDFFRHYLRHYLNSIDSDKQALQSFTDWVKMRRTKSAQFVIDSFYKTYPHLSSFFQAIEDDPSYLSNPYFRHHIESTIENHYLWN